MVDRWKYEFTPGYSSGLVQGDITSMYSDIDPFAYTVTGYDEKVLISPWKTGHETPPAAEQEPVDQPTTNEKPLQEDAPEPSASPETTPLEPVAEVIDSVEDEVPEALSQQQEQQQQQEQEQPPPPPPPPSPPTQKSSSPVTPKGNNPKDKQRRNSKTPPAIPGILWTLSGASYRQSSNVTPKPAKPTKLVQARTTSKNMEKKQKSDAKVKVNPRARVDGWRKTVDHESPPLDD